MGSSGGGGGGDQETTIRYAPYVEAKHKDFLSAVASYRAIAAADSPYSDFSAITISDAFFGSLYDITDFPSLYDMYGKFMAGLDIEALYDQILEDLMNTSEVADLVSAEAERIDDDIETNILPRFQVGMRNMGSVLTSTFIVGKSIIEDARVKAISKFSAELKYRLIPVITERWKAHLEWNKGVIMTFGEIMKLYFLTDMDVSRHNYEMLAKDGLWPFTVLDYERAALGALQGAGKTTTGTESSSGSALGGALSGAAAGAMIGSAVPGVGTGIGAAIGGVLGLGASLF